MKTFKEVINLLIETTEDLRTGKIKVAEAKQVGTLVQTIINASKLHFEITNNLGKYDYEFFDNNIKKPELKSHAQEVDFKTVPPELPKELPKEEIKENKFIKKNTDNSNKSCNDCVSYEACMINPKCQPDRYDFFVKRKH